MRRLGFGFFFCGLVWLGSVKLGVVWGGLVWFGLGWLVGWLALVGCWERRGMEDACGCGRKQVDVFKGRIRAKSLLFGKRLMFLFEEHGKRDPTKNPTSALSKGRLQQRRIQAREALG